MNWEFLKPYDIMELESESSIEEFEKEIGYTFPGDFKDFVRHCNGASFEKECFDVDIEEIGTTDFRPYSFNRTDSISIWRLSGFDETDEDLKEIAKKYINIADTSFGDLICYNVTDNHLYFIDHETLEIVKLADSFTEFSHMLYEDEY